MAVAKSALTPAAARHPSPVATGEGPGVRAFSQTLPPSGKRCSAHRGEAAGPLRPVHMSSHAELHEFPETVAVDFVYQIGIVRAVDQPIPIYDGLPTRELAS